MYFITICTENKNHWFGEVCDGVMVLSKEGRIVEECWLKIPQYYPYVILDSFVVMPNHVHGIIIIDKRNYYKNMEWVSRRDAIPCVSNNINKPNNSETQGIAKNKKTQGIASLQNTDSHNQFAPQSHNLASIIRGFKSGVTKNARKTNPHFAWQSRFYDHIIRSTDEFIRISHYICTNVKNWDGDVYYQNGMLIL